MAPDDARVVGHGGLLAAFAAPALLTLAVSRGRHLAWPVMLLVAGLAWAGA